MKRSLPSDFHEMVRVMKRGKYDSSFWTMQGELPTYAEILHDGFYRINSTKKGPVLEIKKKRTEQVRLEYTTYHSEDF